ncbi:MAG: VWA domain-containing protein [Armatimonadetes bacterium]|nr:VWA domain-containing protein [Armatimonadota bacterium]
MGSSIRSLIGALLLALAGAGAACADGFIIPEPLPGVPRPPNLTVKYHHVDVEVRNGVATTHVDQVFLNEFHRDLEGTYLFPLPGDAAVSDFTLWVDGKPLTGRVLAKEEARRLYESYLRRKVDPALLEYVDRDLFRARVFPIPAKGERRIALQYSQVVPFDAGVYAYRYPLDTERFSARPLQEVAVRVRLDSPKPLKAIYSPSHEIDVQRQGEQRATVSYEQKQVRPDKDFQLYFTVSEADFGLNLLTHVPPAMEKGGRPDKDGFFLLLLAPKTGLAESRRLPKDITFVFDTSGSMSGPKIEQAKKALNFALDNLNPGDRFALLTFSGDVERFRPEMVPATPEAVAAARKFVEERQARGGTNINDALLEGLKLQRPRPGIPAMLVFLTDGLPTVGITEVKQILANVVKARVGETRLFVFGVGDDVHTHLLDRVSGDYGGTSEYVRPDEDLEVKVSSFYTKIATPVLANLELDFGGADAYDVYPKRLPDLFAGSQLLVLGRYRHRGRFTVTLRGAVGGDTRRFTYPADFAGEDSGTTFVPRLWATRKVGFLLDELRLHGENKELVDEITRLGMEYGIVTPYTSSLVEEETRPGAREAVQDLAAALPQGGSFGGHGGAAPAASGPAAVSAARQVRAAKEAARADGGYQSVRHVEGKTFRLSDGVWTDTAYRPEMPRRAVSFASDDYFALLAKEPKLARYFALGERVIVVWQGEALVVAP